MNAIIKTMMAHPVLESRPPVFVDIGASGSLPAHWAPLARYSVCLAFDADDREFKVTQSEGQEWKRLHKINRLVTPKPVGDVDFYLTKSPFCSSSLHPDTHALASWAFAPLFEVQRRIPLPAVDIQDAVRAVGIDYVDWYKADTQGTDLRIFRALDTSIRENVLVADFEPGIIDAYRGEDKLHDVMAYMDTLPFWLSDMKVLGSQRIHQNDLARLRKVQQQRINWWLRSSPGWCELSYINSLESASLGCREYFLAWLFASIKEQHGFALGTARFGHDRFQDPLFLQMQAWSERSLKPKLRHYATRAAAKGLRLVFGRN